MCGMLAVEVRDIGKHTPEMGKTRQAQLTAVPLAEQAEDGSSRHISSFDKVPRNGKTLEKESLGRRVLLILHVILHYRLGISFIKPITSATLQLGNGLCIELIIVYMPGQTDRGRQRNRYETAAAAGVAEDIRNICRGDVSSPIHCATIARNHVWNQSGHRSLSLGTQPAKALI